MGQELDKGSKTITHKKRTEICGDWKQTSSAEKKRLKWGERVLWVLHLVTRMARGFWEQKYLKFNCKWCVHGFVALRSRLRAMKEME